MKTAEWDQRGRFDHFIAKLKKKYTVFTNLRLDK